MDKIKLVSLVVLLELSACGSSPPPVGATSPTGGTSGTGGSGGSTTDPVVLPPGGIVDSGQGPLPSADGANCGVTKNEMQRQPVDLLVVQDRSGSMRSNNKWTQTIAAVNQVVAQTEKTLRWGLKLYAMPYAEDKDVRCYVPDDVTVGIDLNNAAKIAAAFTATPPTSSASGSATPTRFAVEKGTSYLKGLSDGYPKYMLLATDGLPNCANGILSTDDYDEEDDAGAVQAIADAKAAGVPVFVIGIALGGGNATLNKMAEAGGRPRDNATKYYPADDTAGLVEALEQIVGSIPTCSFKLASPPPVPDNVAVDAYPAAGGTQRLPWDTSHVAGWDYTDDTNTAIQIHGTYCDQILNGTFASVQAVFGCKGIPIP